MALEFSRTMRGLFVDSFRGSLVAVVFSTLLLGGWVAWFFWGEVPLYKVSDSARVEGPEAASPLQAVLPGRVVKVNLQLGQEVKSGDVLVELDSSVERRQLAARGVQAIDEQLKVLARELAAQQATRVHDRQVASVGVAQARAKAAGAEAEAQHAAAEVERNVELHRRGQTSDMEFQRLRAEAQKKRALAEAAAKEVQALETDLPNRERQHQLRIDNLEREVARLEGERETELATVEMLEQTLEKLKIRAPVDGVVGEVAAVPPRVGTVLQAGDSVGAVVPRGELGVVAQFSSTVALGRVAPGQTALVRLDNYPWMQYGVLRARVAKAANEARDGRIRVELEIEPDPLRRVPVQHGLTGVVEVEVERVAPAVLVGRVVGAVLAGTTAQELEKAASGRPR